MNCAKVVAEHFPNKFTACNSRHAQEHMRRAVHWIKILWFFLCVKRWFYYFFRRLKRASTTFRFQQHISRFPASSAVVSKALYVLRRKRTCLNNCGKNYQPYHRVHHSAYRITCRHQVTSKLRRHVTRARIRWTLSSTRCTAILISVLYYYT